MPIYDVMLETAPSDLRLLKLLCECFENDNDDATFLQDSIEKPGSQPASLITVDRWPLTGDFSLYASVATPLKGEDGKVAEFLAKALNTRTLYRSGDETSDVFYLIEASGERRQVRLKDADDAREIRIEDVAAPVG